MEMNSPMNGNDNWALIKIKVGDRDTGHYDFNPDK